MSDTKVDLQIDGSNATILFSSPTGINVLSTDVLHSLGALLARLGMNSAVKSTVIQAEGKVFLAGADIKEMANYGPDEARQYGQLGQDVFNDLSSLPSITVAAINGAALGGGLELALACDFRIAVKSAKLGLPEVTLGLIPGWGGIGRLNRLIGPARSKRIFLSGTPISAEVAYEVGLVNEVVPTVEDLGPRVRAFWKKEFGRSSPMAIDLAKRAWRDCDDLSAFAECFNKQDSKEGIAAFLAKRPASWMEEESS